MRPATIVFFVMSLVGDKDYQITIRVKPIRYFFQKRVSRRKATPEVGHLLHLSHSNFNGIDSSL